MLGFDPSSPACPPGDGPPAPPRGRPIDPAPQPGLASAAPLRGLFDALPPGRDWRLPVSAGHVLRVQEWGRPGAQPVLLLHGGPGSGVGPLLPRVFDPARFHVIAPDQRGAGESQPAGSTRHNTTADLLADLRALRQALGIPRWLVAGGSWGATLALAHALDAPEAVQGLLLRASFLARQADIDDFFSPGPSAAEATAWPGLQAAAGVAAGAGPQALLAGLHRALQSAVPGDAAAAALAWWRWEAARSRPDASPALPAPPPGDGLQRQVARLRVQAHYMRQRCWLDDPPLLQCVPVLAGVPTLLLHGTADRICPPEGAALLHQALPGSRLWWVPGAGHDPAHPGMVDATRRALDAWAATGGWPEAGVERGPATAPQIAPESAT